MEKRVLVTGAGGFIGLNLCRYFVQKGFLVAGIDRRYPSLPMQPCGGEVRLEVGDFRDTNRMAPLLKGADCVVHLASAHLQVSLDAREYWDINVHSMEALLEQARSAGVESFVHVSSVGVYGDLGKMAADEETPCRPQSIYGETKLAGEKKVFQFAGRTGFPIVVLRPAWVYGCHCPRTLKLYKKIKRKRMVVIGAGENLRHPLYVEDFCRAVELAMQRKDGLFLIAGPEILTSRQLLEGFAKVLNLTPPKLHLPYNAALIIATVAEKVFGILGKEPPVSRRSLEFFDTDNAFDISKARRELLFEPIYDLSSGLNHCRPWLEEKTQETVGRMPRPWEPAMTIQNSKRFF